MSTADAIDLDVRDRRPEIMDEPGLDPREHRRALRGLAMVNGLSGTSGRLWRAITEAISDDEKAVRILDVACGGGREAADLALRAKRAGRRVEVVGIDISETALEFARAAAAKRGADVEFQRRDIVADGLPEGFDVVVSSLFLHHLPNDEAGTFLSRLRAAAGRLVLVSDLVRSRWGYRLAWWGCRLLSRSHVVHHDGPLSVRAAFRMDEIRALAAAAGMPNATIAKHWPERFLLSWRRADDQ